MNERIQKLLELLAASPRDCFLMHALGLEYLKRNEISKSIEYFLRVLHTDNDYVGTYYHLAKAYERVEQQQDAVRTYRQGIQVATKLKDQHAKNELQMALDDLLDE
jgi:Tfp pilus assembly protein PilF